MYINIDKSAKTFSIVTIIILLSTYFYILNEIKYFNAVMIFFHTPLIITFSLAMCAFTTFFKWCSKILYFTFVSFSIIAFSIVMYYVSIWWNIGNHYLPVMSEIFALFTMIICGLIIVTFSSFPFKVTQFFFYETSQLYTTWNDEPNVTKTSTNNTDKYKLLLASMNETQLQVELSECIRKEKYNAATLVRNQLEMFR